MREIYRRIDMSPSQINWPRGLLPESCPVHTRNALEINAAPELLWSWLIRAADWPKFYSNCKRMRFLTGLGPNLEPDMEFSWVTFGIRVHTKVHDFVPNKLLSWHGKGLGAEGFHVWVIEASDNGCTVITEEVQNGFVPSAGRFFLRNGLLKYHQLWLEGLAKITKEGFPE